jgi:hypothetical protein
VVRSSVGQFTKGAATATVTAVAALCALTACTPVGEPAARRAAEEFQVALQARDLTAACRLLSDEARSGLELTTTEPCPEALAALGLAASPVRTTEVWGRNAQVVLGSGVLFLAEFRAGWRVTAAGCTSRPDQPYQCAVRS